MNLIRRGCQALQLSLATFALAGCGGGHLDLQGSASSSTLATNPPAVSMAGRWLLSSPGHGQCRMTFAAATPDASQGSIAPEGGCPGKFFTSRKWSYEQGGLVIRDHNGQPLAQLSGDGGQFSGKATSGLPVTLMR